MMGGGNILNRWICIASALALLAAVMTSPLQPSIDHNAFSRPGFLRRNFAIPPTRSAFLSLKSVSLRAVSVKAVRSENEDEKLSRAARPAWCSLSLPPSPLLSEMPCAPAANGLARASKPLRC
jgi:hypothetical protein